MNKMPSTYFNKPKTYEIRDKTTGKVIETTRCLITARSLLPKLKELYDEMEVVKVKWSVLLKKIMENGNSTAQISKINLKCVIINIQLNVSITKNT